MSQPNPVALASIQLLQRYQRLLEPLPEFDGVVEGCSREHLLWMCSAAIDHAGAWPVDKLSRWLGFIQGVLTVRGILSVADERALSRPLFHAAYAEVSIDAPATVGRETLTRSSE